MGWNSLHSLFAISSFICICLPTHSKRFSDDPNEPNEPLDSRFIHPRLTQQFFVNTKSMKSHLHLFKKEYDIKLHNFMEDAVSAVSPDSTDLSMKVTPSHGMYHHWHVRGIHKDMEIILPQLTGRLWRYIPFQSVSFEVRDHDKKKTVRFKIKKGQKKMWLCRLLSYCPSEWYVDYVWRPNGQKKAETRLRYYAVKDQEESSLRFYQSRKEAEADRKEKVNWLANVKRQVNGSAIEKYDVMVRPLEDAAVILVSVVCVDYVDSNAMLQAATEEHKAATKEKKSLAAAEDKKSLLDRSTDA